MVAKIIKEAAIKPDDRFRRICGPINPEPPLIALVTNNENATVLKIYLYSIIDIMRLFIV